MRVVIFLRKTHEVDFIEERGIPLCYINGELCCILVAKEMIKMKNSFKYKCYEFVIPYAIRRGEYAPVWFYLLFVDKANKPIYRIKANQVANNVVGIYSELKIKHNLEFVNYMNKKGINIKYLQRDKTGKFLKMKHGEKGGGEFENISNERI